MCLLLFIVAILTFARTTPITHGPKPGTYLTLKDHWFLLNSKKDVSGCVAYRWLTAHKARLNKARLKTEESVDERQYAAVVFQEQRTHA